MKKSQDKDRKDWLLLLLFLPLGILFMMVAGQRATQLLPRWNLRANIGSNINLNAPFQQKPGAGFAPLRSDILTPPAWRGTFLTPTGNAPSSTPPTLMAFQPSETPTATSTPLPTTTNTTQPTGTAAATQTVTATPSTTSATKPPKYKPHRNHHSAPTSAATSAPTSTATSAATSVVTTIDASLTKLTATPAGLNQGAPDGNNTGCPSPCSQPDGSYFVMDVSSNPVVVHATPPPNNKYDMVYYEVENPVGSNQIAMDQVSIGITKDSSGSSYYQVFNWGDGKPDTNTNVDTTKIGVPTAEVDNQTIPTSDLYKDSSSSSPPPQNSQTGILIDVDTAPSKPPADTYNYVVVVAPPTSAPNNPGDGGQVDSIQVTQVASPKPP